MRTDAFLSDVLEKTDLRVGDSEINLVLSVTEKRGIIPQDQVFNRRLATEDLSKYKLLYPDNVAFNPYLVWAGAYSQWKGSAPGVVSPVYETFRVKEGTDARFIGMLLSSGLLTPYFNSTAIGSVQRRRRTTVPVFLSAKFSLPTLAEQRRIVDLVGSIDNYIDALQGQIDATRTARQGVLSELLSNPGDDWQTTTLGEVARWTSGGTPKAGEASFYGGDIPWCVIGDLTESYVTKTEKTLTAEGLSQSSAKLLPIGAVMIAMYGASIGRTGITDIPMATNQAIASALVDENKINNLFLLQFLQNQKEKFVARGTGGAQPNISQMVIKSWPIDLPSLADQERIVGLIGSFDEQISALETQIAAAQETRSGVLSELLSGDRLLDESYDKAVGW